MASEDDSSWRQKFVDYFVVCGLGLEVVTLQKERGFCGMKERYLPALLDHYPPVEHHHFKIPPLLALTVLPGGLEFYERGPYHGDESSQPRSYPIVLTEADGSKVYVSVVAFRDPVEDDIAHAYSIPPNSYVDRCICLVSHWPFFNTFREVLEEIHRMCFSSAGCSKPIWETVAQLVSSVPMPEVGQSQVLFAVENSLLSIAAPPSSSNHLPYTQISFQPLAQCLDIDHLIKLFTAVALEKRILLRASKYELLTNVAEAACHLMYPFKWMLTYIPVVPVKLLDLIEAPGSYLFGLCSNLAENVPLHGLEGAIIVDLDHNRIVMSASEDPIEEDEIPPLPEPELSQMRQALLALIHPDLQKMDQTRLPQGTPFTHTAHKASKRWSHFHDFELRLVFLRFFASVLNGYRNYVDYSGQDNATGRPIVVFNKQAFMKKRLRGSLQPSDGDPRKLKRTTPHLDDGQPETDLTFLVQLFQTLGWSYFLENGLGSAAVGPNLFDTACEAYGRGREVELPPVEVAGEIMTIAEAPSKDGRRLSGRYTYDRFPAAERSPEQEVRRAETLQEVGASMKRPNRSGHVASNQVEEALRKSFLDRNNSAFFSRKAQEREKEREAMVVDIKTKLYRLWEDFLKKPLEDESLEYGTIYAMIESDAEGIAGLGFMECILEKIATGWDCKLSPLHFTAVKELVVLAVSRATSRNNMPTVLQALQIAAKLHRRDQGNVRDYIQRHIGSLPIWQDLRFWEAYFALLMEQYVLQETNHADLVLEQLLVLAHHMAELGLLDADAWGLLEALANRERISVSKQIRLRGALSEMQSTLNNYFGPAPNSPQAVFVRTHAGSKKDSGGGDPRGGGAESHPGPMSGTIGRSWMPTWIGATKGHPGAGAAGGAGGGDRRARRNPSWGAGEFAALGGLEGSDFRADGGRPSALPRPSASATARGPTGVRLLRGHRGAITAIHAGTRSELGDLLGDGDDVGYFVSGSSDTTVKLWDPAMRGTELRASMEGHRGAVRCISSDRTRVISGGDDKRVLVFDKATSRVMVELGGHEDSVTCIRMLSGIGRGSVLTAGRDGQVKMSDTRSDRVATTVVRWKTPVLCLDYLDHAYMLAAAGTDGVCHVWDVRAGKERYQLKGHTGWIRSVRMVGDAVVTGSDDWTARVWTLNDGQCEAVLACHGGPITAVEYSQAARGIITGSADHTVRLWDRSEGTLRCVETVGVHNAPILSVKAGDRWLAMAAADNSLSLFHRQPGDQSSAEGMGSSKHGMSDWHLLRAMNRAPDLIRQVACDVDRGRICTGSRTGVLRVWDPPLPPS